MTRKARMMERRVSMLEFRVESLEKQLRFAEQQAMDHLARIYREAVFKEKVAP